jgi:hypothetical protein
MSFEEWMVVAVRIPYGAHWRCHWATRAWKNDPAALPDEVYARLGGEVGGGALLGLKSYPSPAAALTDLRRAYDEARASGWNPEEA